MPNRIVSGEKTWKSKKVRQVQPESYRAEYTWLFPLANDVGTFECDPDVIWSTCYATARPSVTVEDVVKILNELERVKLLFRWQVKDQTWGYWTGSDAPGLLPPPSKQYSGGKVPEPDLKALEAFLGRPKRGVEAGNGTVAVPDGGPAVSDGYTGIGNGIGYGKGLDKANANVDAAAKLPTGKGKADDNIFSKGNSTRKGNTVQGTDTPDVCIPHGVSIQNKVIPTPGCPRCDTIIRYISDHNLPAPTKPQSPPRPPIQREDEDDDLIVTPGSKRIGFPGQVTIFARLLYAALPPDKQGAAVDNWEKLWAEDIQGLIDGGESPDMIEKVLRVLPRLARLKFVYRGDSFVSMYTKLKADVVKLEKKK